MHKKIKAFLLHNVTNRQTFAKNAFWLSVSSIGGRLVRGAVVIYAARMLGTAGWGIFSYAITLAAFVTTFVDIGIDPILIRETSKAKEDPKRQKQILSTSFFIKLSLLAIGAAAIIFIAPRITTLPGVAPLLPLMAAIVMFDTLRTFCFSVIRSKEKMELEAGLNLFTNVTIVMCGFVFLYFKPTAASFAFSYAIGTGLGLLATVYTQKRALSGTFSNFSKPLIREILSSAWPLAVSGVLGLLMLNMDIMVIGWFRSAEQVGLYSATVRIIQMLYVLAAVVAQSALPIFSKFLKENDERIRASLERILKFGLSFSIPVALMGITAGHAVIRILFGAAYAGATRSFQILLLTLAFNFVAVILINAVFVYNKQKLLMIYTALGGVMNLAFDLMLIPKFGIEGSAVATLIAQIVADSYLWFLAWQTVRFNPSLKLQKVFFASIVASLIVFFGMKIGFSLFVAGPIATGAYIALLYAMKEPIFKEAAAILRTAR